MFRARIAPFALALAALLLMAVNSARAATDDKRVALVIGNSDYQNTVKLNNPVHDAHAMAAALARLGFDVVEGLDLDQEAMRDKIREFTSKIEGADVTLLFYAGHGLQIDGKNHLAPVDAKLARESDVDFETVPLNLILRQMERERRTNLVFLDACRDNPLAQKLARSMKGRSSSSVSRGLARVESGVGMLIGYATSPGMVAYDGEGTHSPYTNALLKHIETPGLSINDMMIAVRQDVLAESKGKQIPWENSSLTGQYYFKPAAKTATAGTENKEEVKVAATSQAASQEGDWVARAYQATVAVGSCGAYQIFEEQHRNTFYGRLAEEYLRTNCENKNRQIKVEAVKPKAATADGKSDDSSTKKVTVASAESTVAAAPETAAKSDDEAEPDTGALTVSIQQELDRVGCDPGTADGVWGSRTTQAMEDFNEHASLDLDTDEPSEAALTALKAKSGTVCPAPAATTVETPAKTTTTKKKTTTPKVATTKKKAPTVTKKSGPPPGYKKKKKEYWGGEDTRFDCEVRGIITADCFR